MATLLIRSAAGERRLTVSVGQSVREILDATDLRVRAACGGTGACGACAVRLLGGAVNPPSVAEYMRLSKGERAQGARLACQLRLAGDAEIQLDQPAPPCVWKSIAPENLISPPGRLPALQEYIYGVAVDLGTTHIRVALWDRRAGRRIATRRGFNPQGIFGADVLNRLSAVPEHGYELAKLARSAINQAIRDMLVRDVGEVAPMLMQIGQMIVVGNTAMLALLTEHGGAELLAPDNWQRPIDYAPSDPAAWHEAWHLPHVQIVLPAPVAGFVGSDLIADLIATHLVEGVAGALLLDVGTNTEIALWDGQRLHITSVPGGPAFEGVGIRHGMPAETGAICRVRPGQNGYDCEVIGGDAARGLCGSGLADGIAVLLADGLLKPSGRFAAASGSQGYELLPGNPRSAIGAGDVDAFQRAKAATAAAMEVLLHGAGMGWGDIRRLCVCGAFGRHLDIGHAQAVGLLPSIDPALIKLDADATLAGCECALLRADGADLFSALTKLTCPVNLSFIEGYDDRYINHLRLKPISPIIA
ncbi:MAG: ASKHA domain-containing protein [Sulfuricellaceae bacterium]